jgi:SPP1 gp7 family putative phage head morphogenesis protein
MKTVKQPPYPKAIERKFSDAMVYMVSMMTDIYRTQALEALPKVTIKQFSDNYAKDYLAMAYEVTDKLRDRFNDDRIEALADKYLKQADNQSKQQLYKAIEKQIGIDYRQLINEERLTDDYNALVLETAQWAKKLRDDTLEFFTANSLRVMTQGATMEQVMSEFDETASKRKDHAKFVARNQIANFNSMMTKVRAQNLGIEKAVWVTSADERVRPCHRDRNGKEFDLKEGLYSKCDGKELLPGTDFQCRCTYTLILPED